MNRPGAFTQRDITTVLRAAKAAGERVASIEIDLTGKIVAKFGAAADEAPSNDPDDVYDNWKKKRAG